MAQHLFAAETAPSLVDLDANFTEVYSYAKNLRSDAGGNVGIGTATPADKLDISDTSAFVTVTRFVAASGGPWLYLQHSRGASVGVNTLVSAGDQLGSVVFAGANGTGYTPGAMIVAEVDGTPGATNDMPGRIVFKTTPDGSGTPAEGMRLDAGSHLLVGYTSSNGAYKLQVNSQIYATSSTVATSDARYKQAVQPLAGALALVNALQPVSFEWRSHPVHQFPAGRAVGFLAQDVAAALAGTGFADAIVKANAVQLPDGSTEQFLGLAEGNLIALLVGAVRELTARVAALEA